MLANTQDCPDGPNHAKAWSTTVKFLNLHKIICVRVSEHTSALKAQKTSILFPPMAVQMGIKEKSKLFLDILCPCYIPKEEHLNPEAGMKL